MKHRPKIEEITWDSIPRGSSYTLPYQLRRQNQFTGNITPYDLTGSILMLTVKKDEYDALLEKKHSDTPAGIQEYNDELLDNTSAEGLSNYIFRITIDCDNPSNGEINTPVWATPIKGMKEVFHGMYGENPKDGNAVFRIPKRCTFVDPGEYNFDIRIMHKAERTIGYLKENASYLLVKGKFEIYGSPTNRGASQDITL